MTDPVAAHFSALTSIVKELDGSWTLHELSKAGYTSKPKGIYKPKGSPFALSIRRTIGSPYDDPPPLTSGSRFSAVYREERQQHGKPPFTVHALIANMETTVPLAYFNEISRAEDGVPRRFELTGLAIIVDYRNGWFYLEGRSAGGASEGSLGSGPVKR